MAEIKLYNYNVLTPEAQDYAYNEWLNSIPEVEILDRWDECLMELKDLGIIVELRDDTQASITFSKEIRNRAYSRGLPSLIAVMKFYDEISLRPKTYKLFLDKEPDYGYRCRKSNFQLIRSGGVNYFSSLFRTYLKNLINSKDLSLSFYDYLRLCVWALLKKVQKEVNKARSLENFEKITKDLVYLFNTKGMCWGTEEDFDNLFGMFYE